MKITLDKNIGINVTWPQALTPMMNMLERSLVYLMAYMSGQPLTGGPYLSLKARIGTNLFLMTVGIPFLAILAVGMDLGIPAYIVLAIAQTGQMRWAQLVTVHQAAHSKSKGPLFWLGHVISSVLLIEPFQTKKMTGYRPDHNGGHHHPVCLSTTADATVLFILNVIGIEPGDKPSRQFKKFLYALFSPIVHSKSLIGRIYANVKPSSWKLRLSVLVHALVLFGLIASGYGNVVFWGWILPLTLGFQMAQIIRLPVEHRWRPAKGGFPNKLMERRFLTPVNRLTELPLGDNPSITDWSIYLSLQTLNLFLRYTCFPRESSWGHAAHHELPMMDIGNGEVEASDFRKGLIAKGQPLNPINFGYVAALTAFFESVEVASFDSIAAPEFWSRT